MATRHPKKGKWTIRELNSITADWKGDTLNDGNGLYGAVRVNRDGSIGIRWKYAFRWQGRVKWHQCGSYPANPIGDIRVERDKAKSLVADGVNPTDKKRAARIEEQNTIEATIREEQRKQTERLTVADMFQGWITDGVNRKDGNKDLKRIFDKDILPAIGDIEVRKLAEKDIRAMLRRLKRRNYQGRNVTRTLEVAWRNTNQMIAWAEKRKPWRRLLADGNPCGLVDVSKSLPTDYDGIRDRVLSAAEIRELADIFTRMDHNYQNAPDRRACKQPFPIKSRLAVWLCLGTLCRIGELSQARWKHIHWKAGTWFIPKENVKGMAKKKQAQLITLSGFTRRQFKALHAITGHTDWCFPNRAGTDHIQPNTVAKQVGDRQARFMKRKTFQGRVADNSLVLADGINGNWTPHDMRTTGATMMQELHVTPDVIDRCQNHVIGSKVRRHYQHYDYQQEKAEAWHRLGERLDVILSSDKVVSIEQAKA